MEQVVQSNASNAEESASASEELSSQAENMTEIVNSLVSLVNGVNSAQEQAYASIANKNGKKHALPPVNNRRLVSKAIAKKDTKVVTPEDVIPLDDDTSGF